MPKISDLNVKLNVSATFPTDDAYRGALFAALGEVEMLRARVAELDEYVQHSISDDEAQKVYNGARDEGFELGMQRGLEEAARRAHESAQSDVKVVHEMSGSFAIGEPDPATIRAIQDAAKVGHDEYGRRAPDNAPFFGDHPRGLVQEVKWYKDERERLLDEVTGLRAQCAVHEDARRSLRQEVQDFLSGMNEQTKRADKLDGEIVRLREEIARLVNMEHEASEALKELRTERDEAIQTADMVNKSYDRASEDLARVTEEYGEVRGELSKMRDERDALRAEVVRLSAPTPATQYISIITPKDLQGAYERGVEEGRAAAIAELDGMARDIAPGAAAIAQERAIQRAKYTHAHDRRHTGVMWLSLINEAVNRHSVRDWPRTFRVVGALALAALDVLTVEGADHMGPVRKKELPTDHVEGGGSCTPPAADHAAEGLAHQPSPTVPFIATRDEMPDAPDNALLSERYPSP